MKDVSSLSIVFRSELTLTNTSILVLANDESVEIIRTLAPLETINPLNTGSTAVNMVESDGVSKAASENRSMLNSHSVLSNPLRRTSFVP